MTVPQDTHQGRKSSRSAGEDTCVELSPQGKMRDSKNPDGPVLSVNVPMLVTTEKSGRIK